MKLAKRHRTYLKIRPHNQLMTGSELKARRRSLEVAQNLSYVVRAYKIFTYSNIYLFYSQPFPNSRWIRSIIIRVMCGNFSLKRHHTG